MNIKALFLALSPVNALIIFGLSKQFKDDNDEFQRRVNAFIIFGLRFKDDNDEFQRRVNAFIIFGRFKDDDDEFQRKVNAFIIFGSFRRSRLFVVDPYEANNLIISPRKHVITKRSAYIYIYIYILSGKST